jgi:hypothetical protein
MPDSNAQVGIALSMASVYGFVQPASLPERCLMVESSLTMLISLNYRYIEGSNTASSNSFSSHSIPHEISLEPVRANRLSSEDQKGDFAAPKPGSFSSNADQFA